MKLNSKLSSVVVVVVVQSYRTFSCSCWISHCICIRTQEKDQHSFVVIVSFSHSCSLAVVVLAEDRNSHTQFMTILLFNSSNTTTTTERQQFSFYIIDWNCKQYIDDRPTDRQTDIKNNIPQTTVQLYVLCINRAKLLWELLHAACDRITSIRTHTEREKNVQYWLVRDATVCLCMLVQCTIYSLCIRVDLDECSREISVSSIFFLRSIRKKLKAI